MPYLLWSEYWFNAKTILFVAVSLILILMHSKVIDDTDGSLKRAIFVGM